MKLPNLDKAEITERKITAYLLSATHHGGRGKAAFFLAHGFTAAQWQQLAQALLAHAAYHEVAKLEATPFGTRYVIEGILDTPDGRQPLVRAVWFIENNEETPRLATAYPMKKGENSMIKELDSVVLTVDLPEYSLQAGDIGTVVLTHQGGAGYEVEFVTLDGETIAVTTLMSDQVRPVVEREIAHARPVENLPHVA